MVNEVCMPIPTSHLKFTQNNRGMEGKSQKEKGEGKGEQVFKSKTAYLYLDQKLRMPERQQQ